MELNTRSLTALKGVHPKLVAVVQAAAAKMAGEGELGFIVTEGVRTTERQTQLLAAGASRTMNSKHLKQADGFSHAVDLAATVGGKVRWDWPLYPKLAQAMKAAAAEQGVKLVWGGDWPRFRDGPHFQIEGV